MLNFVYNDVYIVNYIYKQIQMENFLKKILYLFYQYTIPTSCSFCYCATHIVSENTEIILQNVCITTNVLYIQYCIELLIFPPKNPVSALTHTGRVISILVLL